MNPDDLLLVGRVARAHGNRGEVIVNPETDFPETRFKAGEVLLIGPPGQPQPRRIRDVRFHRGRPIVALEGIDTMNDAEALAGAELRVPAALQLPEGTFYHHDLVGCEVRDMQGVGLGVVTAVEGPLERSHLVVAGLRGEVLIPFAADICSVVDPAARCIVVNPPEGLVELNERARGDGGGRVLRYHRRPRAVRPDVPQD